MKIAFIFIAFVFFATETPVQSLTVAELFRLKNEAGRGRTLVPPGQAPPPLGTRSSQASSLHAGQHHLAIQVIIIVFCIHTAACAASTALTGASSTLVP